MALKTIARWRQLPLEDRRALWPAAWRLVLVRLLLATRGLKQAQARLASCAPGGGALLDHPEPWQLRVRALQRVASRLPATRCLARSLTLWWWMRSQGLSPQLRIGVAHADGNLQGHAWVECDGHLFDESRPGAARWSQLDAPFRN